MIKKSINPETQECSVTPTQIPQTVSIHAPVSPPSIKSESVDIEKMLHCFKQWKLFVQVVNMRLSSKKLNPNSPSLSNPILFVLRLSDECQATH